MRVKTKNNDFARIGDHALCKGRWVSALVFLCAFFFLSTLYSSPGWAWTSYTQSGFIQPTVITNPSWGYTCPGANCAQINAADATTGAHTAVVCPNTSDAPYPQFALLRRIMPCVKETLLMGANAFIVPLTIHMGQVVAAVSTLAIVLHGAKLLAGTAMSAWRDSMILAVKLGAVAYFSTHIAFSGAGGFTNPSKFALMPAALDIIDNMAALLLGAALNGSNFSYWQLCFNWTNAGAAAGDMSLINNAVQINNVNAVWDMLDCTFEMLIGGILTAWGGSTIQYGLIGFLMSCMVSNGLGATIGLMGFYLIMQFIKAIIKTLYIFITGYMGVTFCMLVAPIFIPCILLNATKGYFMSWLKDVLSFMLQPVIISAYLGMLITAFNIMVFSGPYSITASIVGNAYNVPTPYDFMNNGGVGGWILAQDYTNQQTGLMQNLCVTPARIAECNKMTFDQLQKSCMEESPAALCAAQPGNCQAACFNQPPANSLNLASCPPIKIQNFCLNFQGPSDLVADCLNKTSCVYSESSVGATGVVMDSRASATGTTGAATATQNYGLTGPMATALNICTGSNCSGSVDGLNQNFFDAIGVNAVGAGNGSSTGQVQFMGMDFPMQPVNWDWLAYYNGYRDQGGKANTTAYLLNVVRATMIAIMVGYVFLELLTVMPFLVARLSGGGGLETTMDGKALGMGKLAPPGMGGSKGGS